MKLTDEQITDALVDDIADSCSSDYGYLRSVVREYLLGCFDAEGRENMYRNNFDEQLK